jgi:hypothetical protein
MTHGATKHRKETPEYRVWKRMRHRCTNPNNPRFADWGGRGITVCRRWRKFENFLVDMGARPEGMTLDRIDNDRGYSKRNCRWASAAVQVRNRRNTVWVEIGGVTLCLKDWAGRLDVNYQTVFMRIERGMTPVEALTTPVTKRRPRR